MKSYWLRYLLIILSFFISFNVNSKSKIEKNIILTASIDSTKFFSYSIKEFYFEDQELVIDVDYEKNVLEDKKTNLVIKTDVPSFFPSGYTIEASKLSSKCYRTTGEEINDFAKYFIGGVELKKDIPVKFDDFTKKDEFLWIRKNFEVKFSSLSGFDLHSSRCSGEVILRAQLDF
ncbi:TPA: hypothetical protein ACX6PR_002003 [Photobacterium damselae]